MKNLSKIDEQKDVVDKEYVDNSVSDVNPKNKYLPLSGGTIVGDLSLTLSFDGDIRQVTIGNLLLSSSNEANVVSSDHSIMLVNNSDNANRALLVGLANDIQNPMGIIFSNDSFFNELLGCENGINATYDLNMLDHRIRNVAKPVEIRDSANKEYVDQKIVGLTEQEYEQLEKKKGVLYCIYEEEQ